MSTNFFQKQRKHKKAEKNLKTQKGKKIPKTNQKKIIKTQKIQKKK